MTDTPDEAAPAFVVHALSPQPGRGAFAAECGDPDPCRVISLDPDHVTCPDCLGQAPDVGEHRPTPGSSPTEPRAVCGRYVTADDLAPVTAGGAVTCRECRAGLVSPAVVQRRIGQISGMRGADDIAHAAEDALYRDVLAAIAGASPRLSAARLRVVASTALKAADVEFSRWYA